MNDRHLVRALKALADATRLRIVKQLANVDELSQSEIVDRFSLSQSTISHHLKLLLDAGILVARVEGKHRLFALDRELLERLGDVLPTLIRIEQKPQRKTAAHR
jgi:DNA-binding transcriptional ArsR family regulator